MKKSYVIGLDIGTSSIKGVLISCDRTDSDKTVRYPFKYSTDEFGKVEISADSYLKSCYSAINDLCSFVPEDGRIEAVCADSAAGNILFLDKNFVPITPIINWQDKRTTNEVDLVLGENFDTEAYFLSTGWAFDRKTFPLASLCRLKIVNPELFRDNHYLCMSTEYLLYTITGKWGLSTSGGTPFYLIDQQSGTYREDILSVFGLHQSQLPPVVKTGTVIGKSTSSAFKACGLPEGTPIVVGTFDHPSAARGVGILKPGELLLSCGTSWVGFYPLESRSLGEKNHLLIDPFLSDKGGCWAGMVSLASVASRIEGYIRKYITSEGNIYKTFESFSAQSTSGAGGLTLSLDSSDNSEYITTFPRQHIARAIMECVVNKLQNDFKRLEEGGVKATRAVMVGGPTECPLWTSVIHEITGIDVSIKHGAYAGSIGASMVAGIASGIWKDEFEAGKVIG